LNFEGLKLAPAVKHFVTARVNSRGKRALANHLWQGATAKGGTH